jgi:hypothetical protein
VEEEIICNRWKDNSWPIFPADTNDDFLFEHYFTMKTQGKKRVFNVKYSVRIGNLPLHPPSFLWASRLEQKPIHDQSLVSFLYWSWMAFCSYLFFPTTFYEDWRIWKKTVFEGNRAQETREAEAVERSRSVTRTLSFSWPRVPKDASFIRQSN